MDVLIFHNRWICLFIIVNDGLLIYWIIYVSHPFILFIQTCLNLEKKYFIIFLFYFIL